GGHQRSVMSGQEVGVIANVGVGRRQALGVVVGGRGGGPFGVVSKRTQQFVGNDAQFVAAHVQQRVHAGVNPDAIGRGGKFAVGNKPHLVGVGDDPLGVGGGNVVAQPENLCAQFGGVDHLPQGIFRRSEERRVGKEC